MVSKHNINIGTVLEILEKVIVATHLPLCESSGRKCFAFSYTLNYIHFLLLKTPHN